MFNNYNDILIRDYLNCENKYMESCAKVFKNYSQNATFKRDEDLVWVCQNCGYVHHNKIAPKNCPICGNSRAYFGLRY